MLNPKALCTGQLITTSALWHAWRRTSVPAGFSMLTCMTRCCPVCRLCITMCMTQQPQIFVLQADNTKLKAASEAKQADLDEQLESVQVSGVSHHR